MKELRYSRGALLADDARGAAGLAICAAPLIFLEPMTWLVWVLIACAAVFAVFLLRCAIKHLTVVRVSDDAIATDGPLRARIHWAEVTGVSLKFFATKRRSREGWMQLKLRDGARRIVVDSHLEGFTGIAERAGRAVTANRVEVDIPTRENFAALGVRLDGTGAVS